MPAPINLPMHRQVARALRAGRLDGVRNAGAAHVVDRASEDVAAAVRSHTGGRGATAVFDPVGAATFETSLQTLAPRGCLISYGELSGPVPAIDLHRLFRASIFVTKYNGMRYVDGLHEFAGLIGAGLAIAARVPAAISEVAGRFSAGPGGGRLSRAGIATAGQGARFSVRP